MLYRIVTFWCPYLHTVRFLPGRSFSPLCAWCTLWEGTPLNWRESWTGFRFHGTTSESRFQHEKYTEYWFWLTDVSVKIVYLDPNSLFIVLNQCARLIRLQVTKAITSFLISYKLSLTGETNLTIKLKMTWWSGQFVWLLKVSERNNKPWGGRYSKTKD